MTKLGLVQVKLKNVQSRQTISCQQVDCNVEHEISTTLKIFHCNDLNPQMAAESKTINEIACEL